MRVSLVPSGLTCPFPKTRQHVIHIRFTRTQSGGAGFPAPVGPKRSRASAVRFAATNCREASMATQAMPAIRSTGSPVIPMADSRQSGHRRDVSRSRAADACAGSRTPTARYVTWAGSRAATVRPCGEGRQATCRTRGVGRANPEHRARRPLALRRHAGPERWRVPVAGADLEVARQSKRHGSRAPRRPGPQSVDLFVDDDFHPGSGAAPRAIPSLTNGASVASTMLGLSTTREMGTGRVFS